jgi:glycogen synthase
MEEKAIVIFASLSYSDFLLFNEYMHFGFTCLQVSPTYSREVAGNHAIAPYLYKFHGIINGIDPDIWDPYNDNFIPVSWYLHRSLSFLAKVQCFGIYIVSKFMPQHGNCLRSNAYISYTTQVRKKC